MIDAAVRPTNLSDLDLRPYLPPASGNGADRCLLETRSRGPRRATDVALPAVADGKMWCKYDPVARTKYFRAEVKREGEWWSIRIPELSNLTTQARRLLDAEESARGEIAARLGLGRDAFAVEMEEVRRSFSAHEKDTVESHPAGSGWGLGRLAHPPT